jgi:hypothetical protein
MMRRGIAVKCKRSRSTPWQLPPSACDARAAAAARASQATFQLSMPKSRRSRVVEPVGSCAGRLRSCADSSGRGVRGSGRPTGRPEQPIPFVGRPPARRRNAGQRGRQRAGADALRVALWRSAGACRAAASCECTQPALLWPASRAPSAVADGSAARLAPRSQVHVCGSFTNWLTPIPMAPDGSGGGTVFAVVCNLPPGCATRSATAAQPRGDAAGARRARSLAIRRAVWRAATAQHAKPLLCRAACPLRPALTVMAAVAASAQVPPVQVHRGRQVAARRGPGVRD